MNVTVFRAFLNPVLLWGLGLLVVGTGPLVAFVMLQKIGFFPGNNGLGLGLLFFFTIVPSVGLIIVGVVMGTWRAYSAAGRARELRERE